MPCANALTRQISRPRSARLTACSGTTTSSTARRRSSTRGTASRPGHADVQTQPRRPRAVQGRPGPSPVRLGGPHSHRRQGPERYARQDGAFLVAPAPLMCRPSSSRAPLASSWASLRAGPRRRAPPWTRARSSTKVAAPRSLCDGADPAQASPSRRCRPSSSTRPCPCSSTSAPCPRSAPPSSRISSLPTLTSARATSRRV